MNDTAVKEIYPPRAQLPIPSNARVGNDYVSSSSSYVALDENLMLESLRGKELQPGAYQNQPNARAQVTSATDLKEVYTRNATPPAPRRRRDGSETDDHEYDQLENTTHRQSDLRNYTVMFKPEEQVKSSSHSGNRTKYVCVGLLVLLVLVSAVVVSSLVSTLLLVKRIEGTMDSQKADFRAPAPQSAASDLRIVYKDMCYCLFKQAHNWHVAKDFCLSRRGVTNFVEIRSKDTNDHIMPILLAFGVDGVWLGGSDLKREGNMRWESSDVPVETFSPTQWESGEPSGNFGQTLEHCIEARNYRNETLRWNDDNCEREKPFLCQSPLGADKRCGC